MFVPRSLLPLVKGRCRTRFATVRSWMSGSLVWRCPFFIPYLSALSSSISLDPTFGLPGRESGPPGVFSANLETVRLLTDSLDVAILQVFWTEGSRLSTREVSINSKSCQMPGCTATRKVVIPVHEIVSHWCISLFPGVFVLQLRGERAREKRLPGRGLRGRACWCYL